MANHNPPKAGGRGIACDALSADAEIRPYQQLDVYATTTAFLAEKLAAGLSGSAEEGDRFYDSTLHGERRYNGTDWVLIARKDLAVHPIPLDQMRVWDAFQTNLPGAAANDDMGLITGTLATDVPTLQGVDFGGVSTDEKAAFCFALPPQYIAGETITVRLRAAMLTTVSDGTATVDVECYKSDRDGGSSADLCATAAQSINSLTPANKDFTITPTGLAPGDLLFIRLAFAGSDVGNLGVMIPEISQVEILLDMV